MKKVCSLRRGGWRRFCSIFWISYWFEEQEFSSWMKDGRRFEVKFQIRNEPRRSVGSYGWYGRRLDGEVVVLYSEVMKDE